MTPSPFLAEIPGSDEKKSASGQPLLAAIKEHLSKERASFHTPGHKGRLELGLGSPTFQADLTELPGLDDLAAASSVLDSIQKRAAKIYGAKESFISVNGASAALMAAVLASCAQGQKILLPRNVHRAAMNAVLLSGAEVVWYEPEWLSEWGTWSGPIACCLEELAANQKPSALLLVSPNYAGIKADIEAFSNLCKKHGMILIVDEAHGAHSFNDDGSPDTALQYGAELIVHSLHKTLRAPTQTGILHLSKKSCLSPDRLRAILNSLQSSSPSYLLMLGIERALEDLDSSHLLNCSKALARACFEQIKKIPGVKILDSELQDKFHILIKHDSLSAAELQNLLMSSGIYAETVLGKGVLLLLGLGSEFEDLEILLTCLNNIVCDKPTPEACPPAMKAPALKQILNPRDAFFAPSELIEISRAAGRISADWLAPCPPGHLLIAPGQLIDETVIVFLNQRNSISVVRNSAVEGDSDGPNTPS